MTVRRPDSFGRRPASQGNAATVDYERASMYYLFLDDERDPPRSEFPWTIARSMKDAVAIVVDKGLPKHISFDHDLGKDGTGHDFAKWLIDFCLDNRLAPDFSFYVHSQNPVGAENIRCLIEAFQAKNGFNQLSVGQISRVNIL